MSMSDSAWMECPQCGALFIRNSPTRLAYRACPPSPTPKRRTSPAAAA
jgi:hypothetical protein